MHDELTEDYRDMIYAKTPEEIATRRKSFLRLLLLWLPPVLQEGFAFVSVYSSAVFYKAFFVRLLKDRWPVL